MYWDENLQGLKIIKNNNLRIDLYYIYENRKYGTVLKIQKKIVKINSNTT